MRRLDVDATNNAIVPTTSFPASGFACIHHKTLNEFNDAIATQSLDIKMAELLTHQKENSRKPNIGCLKFKSIIIKHELR